MKRAQRGAPERVQCGAALVWMRVQESAGGRAVMNTRVRGSWAEPGGLKPTSMGFPSSACRSLDFASGAKSCFQNACH